MVSTLISMLLSPVGDSFAIHIAIKVVLQAQQDEVAPEMSGQKISDQVQIRFWIQNIASINRKEVRSRIRGLIINNIEILDERVPRLWV